jgi:hypothetical protein
LYLRLGRETWSHIAPSKLSARFVVFVAMGFNLVAGVALYLWLGFRQVNQASPSFAGLALFSLPSIMFAAMGATKVWNA